MKAADSYVKEEHRRAMALAMLIIGWTGMQAWIIWALVVALAADAPRLPGTLPAWVGPLGIECLLFAITGAMIRSRMRLKDSVVQAFNAGARVAREAAQERFPNAEVVVMPPVVGAAEDGAMAAHVIPERKPSNEDDDD